MDGGISFEAINAMSIEELYSEWDAWVAFCEERAAQQRAQSK